MINIVWQMLDPTDRRIVSILQSDGKLSYHELGEAVGLSAPATFQRVRKLEGAGVITGYHARVDPGLVGRGILAFVRIQPGPKVDVGTLITQWRRSAAFLECHRLSGEDGYLLKVRLGAISELSELLDGARRAGCKVATELALETAFERWTV